LGGTFALGIESVDFPSAGWSRIKLMMDLSDVPTDGYLLSILSGHDLICFEVL